MSVLNDLRKPGVEVRVGVLTTGGNVGARTLEPCPIQGALPLRRCATELPCKLNLANASFREFRQLCVEMRREVRAKGVELNADGKSRLLEERHDIFGLRK